MLYYFHRQHFMADIFSVYHNFQVFPDFPVKIFKLLCVFYPYHFIGFHNMKSLFHHLTTIPGERVMKLTLPADTAPPGNHTLLSNHRGQQGNTGDGYFI